MYGEEWVKPLKEVIVDSRGLHDAAWIWLEKGMKLTPHRNKYHEMFVIIEGRGFMRVKERGFLVEKGNYVYVPPNSIHTIWNEEEKDLEIIWFSFF